MSEPNRRHPAARVFLSIVAILAALIIVPALGLLIINAFDRGDPAAFLPPRPQAFAAVRSLGQTLERLSTLRAADELLSGPDEAGFRSLLVSARSSPLLASKAFRALASVPAFIALEDEGALAAVDLGPLLGAAVRLLPAVGPLLRIRDFSYEASGGIPRILIGKAPSFIRIASIGRILLVSTSTKSIDRAIARSRVSGAATVADSASAPNLAVRARLSGLELSAPKGGALRLIVDVGNLASRLALSGPVAAAAIRDLSFPGEAIVDLDVADDRITLEASLSIESKDAGLASILDRRSGAPAALARLPASAAYASLASAGSPAQLLPTFLRYLDDAGKAAYQKAEAACRSALGTGFDQLLYSWAGDEFGAFGLGQFADPVFYLRVADEGARKAAFDKLVSSVLVDEDLTTVVDGLRIPRLVLPGYLRSVLSLAGADVPQPYWLVERGFLFASASPEALRAVDKAEASGESLPRTVAFRSLVGTSGSDAAAIVYYSLDRGVPFFLRGSSPVERVLRLYKSGVLFLRTGSSGLGLSLLAVRGSSASGLRELPGFPVAAGGRLVGPPVVLGAGSSAVAVLPLSGGRLVARPFAGFAGVAGGGSAEAKLDGDAQILAAANVDGEGRLWALTRQGTIYRFDSKLDHLRPFPLTASARPSSPPGLAPGPANGEQGIAFGIKGGGIDIVAADGADRIVQLPGESALLSPPAFAPRMIAAYPKAFGGKVYLLGEDGSVLNGWPVAATGIAFGSPSFLPRAGESPAVAFLTQAGELSLRDESGALLAGFPMSLDGSFVKAPVVANDGSSIYLINSDGWIFRVSPSGQILSQRREAALKGGEASLLLADAYGNGSEVLFAAGSGDSVYGYSAELESLPGFPAKGAWLPCLADIDGDGKPEIITGGLDDAIHAYSLR